MLLLLLKGKVITVAARSCHSCVMTCSALHGRQAIAYKWLLTTLGHCTALQVHL